MKKRLALIAMSGVRIVNPELRALGLTLPGFIERGNVIASMPSLGLLTIAGATPDHWEITYHEVDDLKESGIESLIAEQPDLVAVSSLSARVDDAYSILDQLRNKGILTVLGGLHASTCSDEAKNHADVVVIGQGEWVWAELLNDFDNKRLKSTYSGSQVKTPLEQTPLPRYDLLGPEKYNRIPLQTTRGCPLDCSFCAASRLISPYKRKPISRVKQEIEAILKIWPEPFIELADDNTFVNKAWSRELASLMADYPQIRWFTETDISLADDEDLIAKLAQSGCAQVLIGFESANEQSLTQADSGRWKKKQLHSYVEKIARIQDGGISVNGCFVFGFDADTPDTFARTWDFIQESQLSEVQITLMTPFPGTSLFTDLKAQGRLLKERFWDQCTLFDVTYQPAGFTVAELESGFQKMVETVYSDQANQVRKEKRVSIHRHRKRASRWN